MSESTTIAVHSAPKASDQLASFLGIDKGMMLETLKAQCFTGKRPEEVTDTQLAAFVSTANVLQVNPLIPGMLYAFPSKNGGIVPILGPEGTFKKLDEHIATGKLEGYECVVYPEDVTQKPTHATATIYRKNAKPATYTALFSEWVVSGSPVWGQKPRHMLWIRAIKQAARQVIHGLPMDAEEYQAQEMQNVTPEADAPKVERADPPKRERKVKGVNAIVEAETSETASAATTVVPPAAEVVKTPEPVVEAEKPADPKPASRAFLKDKEQVVAVCEVGELTAININNAGVITPSVQATVKGEFVGVVYHIGGGEKDGDGLRPAAPWAIGASLKLTITGKANQKAAGKVHNFVEGVEATQSFMEV